MTPNVNTLLPAIEAWLAAHAPGIHAQLTPGASEAQLSELEAHTGHPFEPYETRTRSPQ